MRTGKHAASVVAVATVGFCSTVFAVDTSWTNAAGNNLWSDALNWSAGVPGPDDRAVVQAVGGTIDLQGVNRHVGTLSIGGGFTLINGMIDTPWLIGSGTSSYAAFTSGTILAARGTISGNIVDQPGGGMFAVRALAEFVSPQSYSGPTYSEDMTISAAGGVANSQAIFVSSPVTLVAPLTGPASALGDGQLRMQGSTLALRTTGSTPLPVDVGTISFEHGSSHISMLATGSFPPPPQMHLGARALAREPGATTRVTLGAEPSAGIRFTAEDPPELSGGGSGPTRLSILPYMIGRFSQLTFPAPPSGDSFFTYDTGADPNDPSDDIGLRPLHLGNEYAASITPGASLDNVRLASQQTLSSDASINSLVLPPGGSVVLQNSTLTISSGGLLMSAANQGGPVAVVSGSGVLAFPGEAIIHNGIQSAGAQNRYIIDVPIDAASLTISGGGSLVLNRASSFNGIWINDGHLISAAPGALGTGPIRLRSANLHFEGGSQTYGAALIFDRVDTPFGLVGGHQSIIGVPAGDVVTFEGPLSGGGFVRSAGPGKLRFNGDGHFETLNFVIGGTVEINGTWSASQPDGLTILTFQNNPTLMGTGTILGTVGGGSDSTIAPGTMTERGVLTIDRVRGNGALAIEIDGAEHDQLVVLSSLEFGMRFLELHVLAAPMLGDQLLIIDNQFSGAAVGTFNGLPEGSSLFVDGLAFSISYLGGDGNDVVLTVVPEPDGVAIGTIVLVALLRRRSRRGGGATNP